jgi:hypothetical protein
MADRKSYIPFDFPAFMQDTIHLSDKQKILYQEMIWYQFDREVGFKDGEEVCLLLGKTRANIKHFDYILEKFFTSFEEVSESFEEVSTKLWQKRVKLEIDKRRQKQDEGRIHASKRVYKNDGSPNAVKVSKGKVSKGKEEEPPISPKGDVSESDVSEPKKIKLGEFGHVALTEEEHEKIKTVYGSRAPTAIEMLDAYLENNPPKRKGKKAYTSHYAVMKQGGWIHERIFTGAKTREPTAKGYSNASMWGDDAVTGSNLKF